MFNSNAHPAKRCCGPGLRLLRHSLPLPIPLRAALLAGKCDFHVLDAESVEEFLAVDSPTILIATTSTTRGGKAGSSPVVNVLIYLHYVVYILASGEYELYAHRLSASASMVISYINNKSFTNADFPAIAMTFKLRHSRYLSKVQDKRTLKGSKSTDDFNDTWQTSTSASAAPGLSRSHTVGSISDSSRSAPGSARHRRLRPVETEVGGLPIISTEWMPCSKESARHPVILPAITPTTNQMSSHTKEDEKTKEDENVTRRMHVTTNSKHILTYGFDDGRVIVHQFRDKSGHVETTTEFRCHQCKVICVQSDIIPLSSLRRDVSGNSGLHTTNANQNSSSGYGGFAKEGKDLDVPCKDVIVSLDVSGCLMVWYVWYMKTGVVAAGGLY